ncbi:site-specific integrase [Deinococcus deserti]|uniref:Putative Integrase n=1 Tax=Deinococcus deserti (strain DSM 17065 / CIP 109153 / LMG 22923 / VCD115) TaxID=546414 RepID=C1CVL1_DEIDV|nr:site-specific integrase [Deinococcus deserti]ACO46228.1 putative Integrase [Deinococcus deserti VCD115]
MTGKGEGRAKGRQGWHAGNMEELPSGRIRWRVRVQYPDGTKERRSGTARTKTEAQRAIITAQKEAQEGKRPVSDTLTVGEMVTEYMRAKGATWSQRTALNNDALYTRHVLPELAHLKAAGIDARRLRAYFEWLSEKRPTPDGEGVRPPLGYSGQRQIHVLLSGAYKRAIADGLLRDNPATYARPLSPTKGGTVRAAKVKYFDPEELGRFIEAALKDRWALPLAFLALTGLRIGECLALTWADVQKDKTGADFVEVSKTRSEFEGTYYTGGPKTAAGVRRVYLGGDALALIEDMRRRVKIEARAEGYQGEGLKDHAPVFPSVDGRPMRQDSLRQIMRRTCEVAGVPLLSPHALRHSTGTYLISRGHDPVSVAALLGHAQVSTTLNIYAHALPEKLRGLGYGLADLRGDAGPAVQEGVTKTGEEETVKGAVPLRRKTRKAGPRRKG